MIRYWELILGGRDKYSRWAWQLRYQKSIVLLTILLPQFVHIPPTPTSLLIKGLFLIVMSLVSGSRRHIVVNFHTIVIILILQNCQGGTAETEYGSYSPFSRSLRAIFLSPYKALVRQMCLLVGVERNKYHFPFCTRVGDTFKHNRPCVDTTNK